MPDISTFYSLALGAADNNPLIPNTWEIIITAISFFILLILVKNKIFPMYEKMYSDRVDAIEGGLNRAEEAQSKADAALKKYQEQLDQARHEANQIREEARSQGAKILTDMKNQAVQEATRIAEASQKQREAEHANAVQSLRKEIGSLATDLASRLVGESLNNDERSTRVVDRFLNDLENQTNSEPSKAGSL